MSWACLGVWLVGGADSRAGKCTAVLDPWRATSWESSPLGGPLAVNHSASVSGGQAAGAGTGTGPRVPIGALASSDNGNWLVSSLTSPCTLTQHSHPASVPCCSLGFMDSRARDNSFHSYPVVLHSMDGGVDIFEICLAVLVVGRWQGQASAH